MSGLVQLMWAVVVLLAVTQWAAAGEIHDAVGKGDVAKVLLAHKADVNAGSKSERSPVLEVAAINAHKDVVEVLLAQGAKVDAAYVSYIQKTASDPILDKPENSQKKKAFQAVIEMLSKQAAGSPPPAKAPR